MFWSPGLQNRIDISVTHWTSGFGSISLADVLQKLYIKSIDLWRIRGIQQTLARVLFSQHSANELTRHRAFCFYSASTFCTSHITRHQWWHSPHTVKMANAIKHCINVQKLNTCTRYKHHLNTLLCFLNTSWCLWEWDINAYCVYRARINAFCVYFMVA